MPARSPLNYSCPGGGQPTKAPRGRLGRPPAGRNGTDFAVASVRQVVFNAQLFNPSADGLIVLLAGPARRPRR